MSAECAECGADLVGEILECPECPLRERIAELEAELKRQRLELGRYQVASEYQDSRCRKYRDENVRLREDHMESMLAHDKTLAIYQEREAELERLGERLHGFRMNRLGLEAERRTLRAELERLGEKAVLYEDWWTDAVRKCDNLESRLASPTLVELGELEIEVYSTPDGNSVDARLEREPGA